MQIDQRGSCAGLRKRREDVVIKYAVGMVSTGELGTRVSRIVPFEGQPLVGDDVIRRHLDGMLAAFPDLAHELTSIHHAADAVIVEGHFSGTQAADWQGIPNQGRRMELPVAVLSQFDGELLVGATLYYDRAAAVRQLV
jgi:predicted ester cyclase